MRSRDPVVGYLPKGFPRISETFVTAEILELERLGLDLRIYPLKKPETSERQSNVRRVIAPVRYVPERVAAWLPLMIPVHLLLAIRRPRAYGRALGYTLSRCTRQRSTSTLRRFAQAGYMAGWMLRDRPVRHIHAHFCHGSATVAMFLKWLTDIPYSFTAHAKDLYMTEPDILRDKMRHAEFVVTCTSANERYLQETGGGLAPIHRIYHGLDLSRFTRGAADQIVPIASRGDRGRAPLLLSVGRLVDKKGFDTLVRACALLHSRGVEFRCAIYGEGPKRDKLQALIAELQLGDVVSLPGAILQDELVDVYRAATAFALPCQVLDNGDRDGLPNVLVEAMAMEVPVVSTNVSGVPELVEHGINGFMVPPRDPAALADALETLFRDPALRRRMAREGRRKVDSEFDVARNTRRLWTLFQEAMGLRPVASESAPAPQPGLVRNDGIV